MSRCPREPNCEASRLPRATAPTALAPANVAGPATARGRSTPHCRRKPLPLAASALVVNAIMFDGRTLGLAIPDGNRACGLRLEHGLSDRFADQLRDTAPRACRGHAQRVEFFLPQVNLGFYHMCHFTGATDIHQLGRLV